MFPRWTALAVALLLVATNALLLAPATAAPLIVKKVPMRVVIGEVKLLEIDGDVRTVIVATPDVADVTVTSPRKLLLRGKKPGSTGLLVLDSGGKSLLDITLMIAPSDEGVVTVDRGINPTDMTCAPRCVAKEASKDAGGAGKGGAPGSSPPIPPPTVRTNQ